MTPIEDNPIYLQKIVVAMLLLGNMVGNTS